MPWVDLSSAFAFGSKLTSQQQQQLRDNIKAAFDGDANAPPLLTHPIWSNSEAAAHSNGTQSYNDYSITVFRKKAGMETVRLYARIRRSTSTQCQCRLRIGGNTSSQGQTTSGSYVMVDCGSIDISGLSNDTNYEMAVQIRKGDSDPGNALLNGFAVYLE